MPELGLELFVHPMHQLDGDDHVLLDAWLAWRPQLGLGGMSRGVLPFAGGALDQPACVMASLEVMESAARALDANRPQARIGNAGTPSPS